jgi:hypothetical protein
MKINEIISESKLRTGAKLALPDLETYKDLDNNNNPYLAYRFGVALAGSPDISTDPAGPIASQFATIGYTDADKEIIDGAKRMMGVKSKQQSPSASTELPWVNTQSPVQPKGPIKPKRRK